jgi:hypothetical protein
MSLDCPSCPLLHVWLFILMALLLLLLLLLQELASRAWC